MISLADMELTACVNAASLFCIKSNPAAKFDFPVHVGIRQHDSFPTLALQELYQAPKSASHV